MKIKILYEDKDILAIDKPSGIFVHPAVEQAHYNAGPDGKKKEEFITDWVLKNYPKIKNVGEPILVNGKEISRPGIVHRLDKDTSGVLLLAKNQKAYEFLKKQFKEREIKKVYYAVVSGFVKNNHGVINKPIGRSPSDFRRRLAGRGAKGELREAITEYKVLKRFKVSCTQNFSSCALPRIRGGTLGDKNFVHTHPFTLLEIYPKTGRTHQIRVHMKYLNHPVVCDSLYNPNKPHPLGFDRLALHSKSIEFSALGRSASGGKNLGGKTVKVESSLPKEFLKITKL